MWEINIWDQTLTFLFSILLGMFFCLFYDVFRALRKAGVNSFISVFVTDMLFWIISAFVTYLFLLSRTNGQLRGYVLLSMIGGFALCRISISNLFLRILTFLFALMFKGFRKINNGVNKIIAVINTFFDRIYIFFAKKHNTWLNSAKKVLKNKVRLLYTKQAGNKARKKTDSEHILDEF